MSGKLIALASITNEIREIFRCEYPSSEHLVLVTTTSLYGKCCSQYNRIKFNGMKFYKFIGETKGYGHIHIPDDVYEDMKMYLKILGVRISYDIKEDYNYKFKIISRAIRQLGFSEQKYLNHGIKKGIFISPLASNWKEYLLGGHSQPTFFDIRLDNVIRYWKERWLKMRLKNKRIVQEVKDFKKDTIRVSNLLKKFSS